MGVRLKALTVLGEKYFCLVPLGPHGSRVPYWTEPVRARCTEPSSIEFWRSMSCIAYNVLQHRIPHHVQHTFKEYRLQIEQMAQACARARARARKRARAHTHEDTHAHARTHARRTMRRCAPTTHQTRGSSSGVRAQPADGSVRVPPVFGGRPFCSSPRQPPAESAAPSTPGARLSDGAARSS